MNLVCVRLENMKFDFFSLCLRPSVMLLDNFTRRRNTTIFKHKSTLVIFFVVYNMCLLSTTMITLKNGNITQLFVFKYFIQHRRSRNTAETRRTDFGNSSRTSIDDLKLQHRRCPMFPCLFKWCYSDICQGKELKICCERTSIVFLLGEKHILYLQHIPCPLYDFLTQQHQSLQHGHPQQPAQPQSKAFSLAFPPSHFASK